MMRRIDVTETEANGTTHEYTFRSNENGCYLFIGVGENKQISCESGFQSLRRMKTAIREYLRRGHFPEVDGPFPRLSFRPSTMADWEK